MPAPRGDTARQMAQALTFYLPQDDLPPAFNALGLSLISQAVAANRTQEEAVVLRFANELWCRPGEVFSPGVRADPEHRATAPASARPTSPIPRLARQTINGWVEQETGGRISNLITPSVLQPTTPLVLTNAIYFKGLVGYRPFPPAATRSAPVPPARRHARADAHDAGRPARPLCRD